MKWPVEVFEDEFGRLSRTRAESQSFRGSPAKHVYPMRDIAFASVVIADIDNSFICRRVVYIFQMKLQKLMIEYPFRLEAILHWTAHYFSRHLPIPNKVIKHSVLEDALRLIKRFLVNRMSGSRYNKPYH